MLFLLVALLFAAVPASSPPVPASPPAPLRMADSTQTHYAQKNVRALQRLLRGADTRAERLLCRYRLYPLTEDERYLDDLPDELGSEATAREQALLAGLWGYRAAETSLFGAMQAGRRSMRLLGAARAQDPDDPVVLLVEGQSLLFRPAIAGGSSAEALQRFRRLREVLAQSSASAVAETEAALWTWYALRKTGHADAADALHQKLAASDLPPLYREFLQHPPG